MKKFLGFLGRGLDLLRKGLHLVLLLVIFGFIVGMLGQGLPRIGDGALVVVPRGEIVEQLSGDPVERAFREAQGNLADETLLWTLLDGIRAAKDDKRVKALVLKLDELTGGGQPTLSELNKAIAEFRASGKKVIATGAAYAQPGYFVAAHADEIYLDPQGFVLIEGYGRYRQYYKNLLDKLSVDMNVFRVGAYKSAVETYTRTDMSAEDREESSAYLESLWRSYQQSVTAARKLPAEAVSQYVASLAETVKVAKGDAAKVALEAKLITAVATEQQFEQRLIELVGEDDDDAGRYKAIDFADYSRWVAAERATQSDSENQIGVLVASGEILDGSQPPGVIGGETTAALVRTARNDEAIKALVLRVDSPGGSVFASEQIRRELQAFRASGRPVVVSMGDLAASGGYYIAAEADEIHASAATITGSIGIFGIVPTIGRTLDKVGVTVDGVGTTPLAGQLRIDRPLGAEVSQLIQSTIEKGYNDFVGLVANGRKKTAEEINTIAQGRVWSGDAAVKNGLVDVIGDLDGAVRAAAKRAKLGDDYQKRFIEPELSLTAQLAQQFETRAARFAGRAAQSQLPTWATAAQALDPLARELARWQRVSAVGNRFAYCFCSVQ
jgi:protease-4